jgi:uncharacterized iron-regulated protein
MKQVISIILTLTIVGCTAEAHNKPAALNFYDVARDREVAVSEVLPELAKSRLVLVGEHHTNQRHHAIQLKIIQMLHESGLQVAVGMEMFSSESQAALDDWVDGRIDRNEFEKIYFDNWNYPWQMYGDIFTYAKAEKIPLVGLNVPREITRQVAYHGFKSLSEEQKDKIANVTCRVDKAYMDYIRKAFGAHGHGNLNFIYFCEAQLVWDTAMAINALRYLTANPKRVMVILAGAGHVHKQAIPAQVRERSNTPLKVILPEVAGSIEKSTVTSNDMDYLILE